MTSYSLILEWSLTGLLPVHGQKEMRALQPLWNEPLQLETDSLPAVGTPLKLLADLIVELLRGLLELKMSLTEMLRYLHHSSLLRIPSSLLQDISDLIIQMRELESIQPRILLPFKNGMEVVMMRILQELMS